MELVRISPFAAYVATFLDATPETVFGEVLLIFASTTIAWLFIVGPLIFLSSLIDRKMSADIQVRIGPNRSSPFGVFQPLADLLKSLFKEDVRLSSLEPAISRYAILMGLVATCVAIGNIPFSESLLLSHLESGVLLVLMVIAFSHLCFFSATYVVRSSRSVLAAFRFIVMLSAYIVPICLGFAAPILISGSLDLDHIVRSQGGMPWRWFVFHNPGAMLSFITGFIGILIWHGDEPFDLPYAVGEISGGMVAEYSGTRRSILLIQKSLSLLLGQMFIVTSFLGGWNTPFAMSSFGRAADIVQLLVFIAKVLGLFVFGTWIRRSLPRQRVDQLVNMSWRFLVPAGLLGVSLTALWMVAFSARGIGDLLWYRG